MKIVRTSLLMLPVMSVIFGIAYPVALTGLGRALFPGKTTGSLVTVQGRVAGSELIGQKFSAPKYFHGRPSVFDYDALNSGGSNSGPTKKKFIDETAGRADEVRKNNGLPGNARIPAELVLASGSGLDPHISLHTAIMQAARVARERNIAEEEVINLVNRHAEPVYFGIYGGKSSMC